MRFALALVRHAAFPLLTLGASLTAACGGSEPSEPSLLGTWVGAYTDTEGTEAGYTLTFNADGTMIAMTGVETGPTASGTWTLAGLVVDASYAYDETGQQFTIRGTMSADGASIEGTYGPGIYPAGLGEFSVQKE